MADYNKAYDIVINRHEHGYVNDPDDPGGETWDGIARRYNRNWYGWVIIDSMKKNADFPKCLYRDQQLLQLKKKLYRDKYWFEALNPLTDDELATELFDISVNMGKSAAAVLLQKTINLLNNNEKLYRDIWVDGIVGNQTFYGLLECIKKRGAKIIVNVLNGYQMKHYIEVMEKTPLKEKYIGWFKRVTIVWG